MIKLLIFILLYSSPYYSHSAEIFQFKGKLAPISEQTYQLVVKGDNKHTSFTLNDLEKLTLYKTNFKTKWGLEGEFVGVKLLELLKHAGISSFKRLLVRASNDYKTTIEHSDLGIETTLVATRLNGIPFNLSDKGPFFIIWPSLSEQVLSGDVSTTKWAWSTIEIQKIR